MVETFSDQVETLERRLHEGWVICNRAAAEESDDLERFEDFWLGLLAEYEDRYDRLWGRK